MNFNQNIANWDVLNKLNQNNLSTLEFNFNYKALLDVNSTPLLPKTFSNIYLENVTSSTLAMLNLSPIKGLTSNTKKFPLEVKTPSPKLEILFDEIRDESSIDYIKTLPDGKLYYPEPFIASPSFLHEEIWFIHILHYNYWLWFFFISLITFYFITFIHVVRWCNLRAKPKRETRGVSRSKCADLITACVPVSWALSIIISETVDATDYYDGFGTGEVVIGIRAYQWGWEYFYPKNIDLNYNVRPSYSSFIGNSIKYNNASSQHLDANTLWKFYQKKNKTGQLNTPAYVILSPNDEASTLNSIDFSNVGNSITNDPTTFRKIGRFSKISSNNISTSITNSNLLLEKINNIYTSENYLNQDTYQYGSARQHNFSSLNSFLPYFTSLVDNKSFKTFVDYSLNTQGSKTTNGIHTNFFSKAPNKDIKPLTRFNWNLLNYTTDRSDSGNNSLFKKFLVNFTKLSSFNTTTDGRNNSHPLFDYYSKRNKKRFSDKTLDRSFFKNDLVVVSNKDFYSWNVFNLSKNYRFIDLKATNLQFLSPDKNLRLSAANSLSKTNNNFSEQTNTSSFISNNQKLFSNLYTNAHDSTMNWVNPSLLGKTLSTNTTMSANYNLASSSSHTWSTLSYDKLSKHLDVEVPEILRSKEELAPEYLFKTYWDSYFRNICLNNSYKLTLSNFNNLKTLYLPPVSNYSEYNFKNIQALESLEDAIWESSHSSLSQDEYAQVKASALSTCYYDIIQSAYNSNSRTFKDSKFKFRFKISYRPLTSRLLDYYSLPIHSECTFSNPSNLNLVNFNHFNNAFLFDGLDDNYQNVKNIKLVHSYGNKNTVMPSFNYVLPSSFTQVLDAFRSDFDENNWDVAQDNPVNNNYNLSVNNSFNITNPMKLRSTAKNSIVTYNAIQKVYRSRFDELRSNVNFADFTNSFAAYPFLLESKTPYESLIKKNKETFYNVNHYTKSFNNNYSELLNVFLSLNTNFTDIPFLLSLKSDASRYLWFDWQARWSSIEVQPSSIAKYSLAGLPYTSKKFEYSTALGDELSDSENYLTKVSRARKNYMPNWAYSSLFYSKMTNWFFYKDSFIFFDNLRTQNFKFLLKSASVYWEKCHVGFNGNSTQSTPSYSGLNRSNTITWSPINGIASYYYATSILTDILSKREYLYRDFYKSKAKSTILPKFLKVSINNSILNDIRASYSFIDPTTYGSEISRELLYQNINFLRYSFTRDFLKIANNLSGSTPINFNLVSNYFVHLFGYSERYGSLQGNLELYKSQYRPMRKGITNMIRLQATNAIAMPTEIRLHILASSKDVIHSWAIPSAGIKIDCVPGFSSHRVAIFLQHGIFWGQCMEICGRYHHWMPIVVYFMKRDLFFLWCTHFMHYSDINQSFNMTDKQMSDYIKLVSFDKSTWVNELNNSII
jgi:heme/copper-type cytochrome/quinol oxidase subunit 2